MLLRVVLPPINRNPRLPPPRGRCVFFGQPSETLPACKKREPGETAGAGDWARKAAGRWHAFRFSHVTPSPKDIYACVSPGFSGLDLQAESRWATHT